MNFSCMAGVEYKGNIYFSVTDGEGFFCLDTRENTVRLVGLFNVPARQMPLFQFAGIRNNIAWFMPGGADKIAKINLDTLEMEYIGLKNRKFFDVADTLYFYTAFITGVTDRNRYLFCTPRGIDALAIVDMEEDEILYVNGVNHPRNQGLFSAGFVLDDQFYLTGEMGIYNAAFDASGTRILHEKVPSLESLNMCIVGAGENCLYINDRKQRSIMKHSLFDGRDDVVLSGLENDFCNAVDLGDEILFFPLEGRALLVNKKNSEARYASGAWDKYKYTSETPNRMGMIASENGLYMTTGNTGFIFRLDAAGDILNAWDLRGEYKGKMLGGYIKTIKDEPEKKGFLLFEGDHWNLSDLTDALSEI